MQAADELLTATVEMELTMSQEIEIGAAKDFLELRLIDGQRLRSPLGQGRVAIIYIVRDVREKQRPGER